MKQNFIKRLMKLLTVLLVFQLILIIFNGVFPKKVSASITREVIQQKEAMITNGVIQEEIHLKNHLGNQRLTMLSVDLNNKDLSVISGVPYKSYPGLETVTGIANRYSKPDDVVVGAINADFFNTSTGAAVGLFIRNGEILNIGSRPAFGITSKGKAIIGYPEVEETGTTQTLKEPWNDVVEAVGGNIILVQNKEKTDEAFNHLDGAVAPRTAVGIKDDGSVFFLVNDGRNPGYSEGMDLNELADLMLEMGAIQAINLDGGGSSTLVARQPGDAELSVVNFPSDRSDGSERKVANALLIRSSAPAGELSSIAIQPNGTLMLANSETNFKGIGLDAAHNPVEINDSITWSLSNDIGTVTNNGVFIAGKEAGKSDLIASYGSAEGSVQIEVVDQPDRIKLPQKSLIIKREGTFDLAAKVYHADREVTLNQHLLNWEIEGDIGTVDENGIFTAQNKTGEGSITVSYGDVSDQIFIEVGKQPVIVEDFENGIDHWDVSGASYKSVNISQTTYPDPTRFGKHALKIDYDFTDMPGTSGVYAHTKDQYILDGYPSALGMWVYGDGNEHWLRSQLRDGEGNAIAIDFIDGLDWEGWKYIEAPIPSGHTLPLKLDLAIRYMEINADKKDKGTIYIDDIRTVYGEADDDLIHPTITDVSPKEGSIIPEELTEISAVTEDDLGGTGINPESIEMFINNEAVPTSFNPETGKVTFSSKKALEIGTHSVKLLVQDHYGNLTERSWEFSVEDPVVGADKVSNLLTALPKKGDVKLKHKEAIKAGRLAFDELTDDQQKLVSDEAIARLINAELELAALEDVAVVDKDEPIIDDSNLDSKLPSTALGLYNYILIGVVFLILGIIPMIRYRRFKL